MNSLFLPLPLVEFVKSCEKQTWLDLEKSLPVKV